MRIAVKGSAIRMIEDLAILILPVILLPKPPNEPVFVFF